MTCKHLRYALSNFPDDCEVLLSPGPMGPCMAFHELSQATYDPTTGKVNTPGDDSLKTGQFVVVLGPIS